MGLTVKNLVSGYNNFNVIKDISFEVASGELVALIGLNGAGKSTTIKNIMGLLPLASGDITVAEISIKSDIENYRKKIGYIPETPAEYKELTLKEHIEITAMAYDIDQTVAFERASKLLKTFRLEDKLDWMVKNFSKGMKQKVMLVCAFLADVDCYIVDEPFLGLDPLAIQALLDIFVELKNDGKAILMSTHILATAERYCDRFVILHEGVIIADGTIEELRVKFEMPSASLDEIYLSLTRI
ncbi:MAG: ABC transporter ATP-binding protein [Lactobacillales bacterium]|jgi:ABC-2 type transport system ATP-binding protein|nr:ABC transporter ATP-binding protein [Lactobacillales bacterium]